VQPESEQVERVHAKQPQLDAPGGDAFVPLGRTERRNRGLHEGAAVNQRAGLPRLGAGQLDGGDDLLVLLGEDTPADQLGGVDQAVAGGETFERDREDGMGQGE
jgi:hypothetical protein